MADEATSAAETEPEIEATNISRINEALRQALDEAITNDSLEIVTHAPRDPTEWRRDWIRRIAMHIAACDVQEEAGRDIEDQRERKALARQSVQAAVALWCELESYFAAEAEQEGEDDE